jgi:hypothetical protein
MLPLFSGVAGNFRGRRTLSQDWLPTCQWDCISTDSWPAAHHPIFLLSRALRLFHGAGVSRTVRPKFARQVWHPDGNPEGSLT